MFAAVGLPDWERDTWKVALIVIGVALEVLGLVLTASPELAPRAHRVMAAVRHFGARVDARIRRILRRRRHYVMEAGVGGVRVMGGQVSGYASVSEDAPLERQLAFFREQAEQAQQRLSELEHRVGDMPGQWRKDVADARTIVEARITQELEKARELFIVQRLIGLTCIATGSVVLAIVNLL